MNMWTCVTWRWTTCLSVAWHVYSCQYMAGIIVESVSIPSEVVSRNTACRGSLFSASCSTGKLVVRDLYFGFKDYATLGGTCYIDDVASVSDPCCVYNNTDDCLVAEDGKTSIRATVTGESSPGEVHAADILDSSCYSNDVQSQYMLMEYYCIPDSRIVTCSGTNSPLTVTDASALYLYNMNYFEECSCSVEMANCTSPLTVYTIVLDLYSNAGECHHAVNITDGGVSQIRTCDDNTNYTVSNWTADSNYLLISFSRNTAGTGGSWMGFTVPDIGKYNIINGVSAAPQDVQLRVSCPSTDQALCVDCGPLADPENGTVSTSSGTTYSQTVIYTCNQGYDLVGDAVSTCLANGTWSNAAPQCIAVDCGALADPGNGTVSTSSGTKYGQSGIYTCNQGYDSVGDTETRCLANATWSNDVPQCIAVADCGALADPGNGTVSTSSGTKYGQSGIYTCNQGYDSVGDTETTCLANATWSNDAPQCIAVDCGALADPGHGTVSTSSGTKYGQRGIYTCNQGYDSVGDTETTCLANATWSNGAPQCIAVDCGGLTAPENGTVSTSNGTTDGQTGIYTCKEGYDLVGDAVTTCLANGTWSNAAPQCKAVGNNDDKDSTTIVIIVIVAVVSLAITAVVLYYILKCRAK